jgi:hypothetical protein
MGPSLLIYGTKRQNLETADSSSTKKRRVEAPLAAHRDTKIFIFCVSFRCIQPEFT